MISNIFSLRCYEQNGIKYSDSINEFPYESN